MSMVDSVLLLVDAADGPMPQTRFVTQKAFARGLNPIVVINKIDREGARVDWVLDQVFDLFDRLGASDEQLDFPVVYTSALNGISGIDSENIEKDMSPLLDLIIEKVKSPNVDPIGPFQMQISALDYTSYVGVIGIGRVTRGSISRNTPVTIIDSENKTRSGRVLEIMGNMGVERISLETASAGDIICVTGIDGLNISDTLCSNDKVEALPTLTVDEPTVSMSFQVNDSPFAGLEGKYVTSRNIKERLEKELLHNVALKVEDTDSNDKFKVSGRGELHLSVLIETMRREGFELSVGRPEVVQREIDGIIEEPFESVVIDCEEQHQGSVMEALGKRKGDLKNMVPDGKGRVRLDYIIPARGLIGFRSEFLTMTSGAGILTSVFDHYGQVKIGELESRNNGVLISNVKGKTLAYALYNLQDRGRLMIDANIDVYEGQIVGIHSRGNDLTVNPTKAKQLTNVRASGSDEATILSPPIKYSLEQALEFIEDDELVEVTPESIRLRKKFLQEHERKRAKRL